MVDRSDGANAVPMAHRAEAAVANMHGLVDAVLLIDDDALIEAMSLVHAHAGLVAEPSGVGGLAVILANPERFERATVLTGKQRHARAAAGVADLRRHAVTAHAGS